MNAAGIPLPCVLSMGADADSVWCQNYGRELNEAYECTQKYKQSRKEAELHQAWDLYYHVFKRINKQLPTLTVLELQYVAPALVRAQVWPYTTKYALCCRIPSRNSFFSDDCIGLAMNTCSPGRRCLLDCHILDKAYVWKPMSTCSPQNSYSIMLTALSQLRFVRF